jgi:hypothetical protein
MLSLSAICWAKIAEGTAKATQAAVARKSDGRLFITGCPFCTAEARSRAIQKPAVFSRIAFIGITSRLIQPICGYLRVMRGNTWRDAGIGETYANLVFGFATYMN